MKNILNIITIFVFIVITSMVQINAQTSGTTPQEESTSGCKTNVVEPEFEFTYPPDEDPGDPDGDDDEEEEEEEEDNESKDERKVMFVHGYKGSTTSWTMANNYLANRAPGNNYISLNEQYTTENEPTLDNVATQIQGKYFANASSWSEETKRKSFFIAHSMGGMALRYMQKKYSPEERPYGGIITVGSGHNGVYAANMVTGNNTKKFDDFFVNACTSLAEPRIIEMIPSILFNILSITGIFKESTIEKSLCRDLALPAVEFIMGELIDENLTTHAATNYPQTLDVNHKLALYGVEENEGTFTATYRQRDNTFERTINVEGLLLPKFFGSVVFGPNIYPEWNADNSDAAGLSMWSETIYNMQVNREKANYKLHQYINGLYTIFKVKKQRELVESYGRGLRWMRDANFEYQELIGGIQNIQISNQCNCTYSDPISGVHLDFTYQTNDDCASLIGTIIDGKYIENSYPLVYIAAQKNESDGFVLANSAKAMPGQDRPIRMQGSGHFQMRNDSNLGIEFENIFKRSTYGEYWKIIKD